MVIITARLLWAKFVLHDRADVARLSVPGQLTTSFFLEITIVLALWDAI